MNGKEAFERGLEFYGQGEYLKAIECYEKAIEDEKFETPGNAWLGMGVAYDGLGEYEKAIDCYKKAIKCDPEDANAYNNLGEVLYKLKRSIDAEEQFRKAIQIKSDLDESHYYLGNILTDEECYEDAKKEYEMALEAEPTDADYLNSLGYVLVELGQYKKAKENFKKAISSDPAQSKAHHNLRALKKISEMKYRIPAFLRYGLMAAIIFIIISAYWLFDGDKLSGNEFCKLIIFFMSLLVVTIL